MSNSNDINIIIELSNKINNNNLKHTKSNILILSSKHALLPFIIEDKDRDIYIYHIMSTMRMSSEMIRVVEIFKSNYI